MTIPLHILTLLQAAGPDLLTPEEILRMDLRQNITPAPTLAEINSGFREIEERRLAVALRDDLGRQIRWKITTAGRAALAERNLL